MTRRVIMGNHAVSYGVMLARAQVIAAYPITPQTQVVEFLSEMCADGRLAAKFIKVESEHSALACCIGAATAGCRTFTATSAQGLALMHELLHWATAARLPIVMANVNRALAPGWNIWCDQTDSLAQRDTGWMQFYCDSNQEILDSVLLAYRVAEKSLLPAMVVYDAFYLSHTSEPVDIPEQEEVDAFLPPFQPPYFLDTDNPRTFYPLLGPEYYMEFRYQMEQAMEKALKAFNEAGTELKTIFGREYHPIEYYRCEDAELILLTAGSAASTARVVIDQMRVKGYPVGLMKIRLFRPFPGQELREALRSVAKITVLDRNLSPGIGGIFAQELKAVLVNSPKHPAVFSFIAGLGGRDITPQIIQQALEITLANDRPVAHSVWLGLQEEIINK